MAYAAFTKIDVTETFTMFFNSFLQIRFGLVLPNLISFGYCCQIYGILLDTLTHPPKQIYHTSTLNNHYALPDPV